MKFLKNYFLAFLILLSFVAFGFTTTVRAESGSDDNDDTEEVEDSNDDSESDSDDDSDDDSESDDSGNDSASDLDDSDEDIDDDSDDDSNDDSDDEYNSGPGNWKDRAPFPLFKKVGSERPGLFPNMIENKIKMEEKDGEFKAEFESKMENRSPVAEARMRVGARIEAHTKNFENLKLRITSRVEKMEAEGIDVSGIESAISTLDTKLDAANSAHEEMKDLFESDTADKASVEAAAEKIKNAMLEVHDAFKSVIEAMKEAVSASSGEVVS